MLMWHLVQQHHAKVHVAGEFHCVGASRDATRFKSGFVSMRQDELADSCLHVSLKYNASRSWKMVSQRQVHILLLYYRRLLRHAAAANEGGPGCIDLHGCEYDIAFMDNVHHHVHKNLDM